MKAQLLRQKGDLATWVHVDEDEGKLSLLVTGVEVDPIFGVEVPKIFQRTSLALLVAHPENSDRYCSAEGYEDLLEETNKEILRRLVITSSVLEQPDVLTGIAEREILIQSLYEEVDALKGDKDALEKRVARLVEDVTHGKQRESDLEQKLKEAEASCAYLDSQVNAAKRELEEAKALAKSGEAFREQSWKEALGAEVETPASPANDVTGFDAAAEQAARIAEGAQPTTSVIVPIVDADPGDESLKRPKPKTKQVEGPVVNQGSLLGWSWPFSWSDAIETIRLTVNGATTVGIVKELGINSATIQSIRTAFQPEINSLKRRGSSDREKYLAKMKADFARRAGVKAA